MQPSAGGAATTSRRLVSLVTAAVRALVVVATLPPAQPSSVSSYCLAAPGPSKRRPSRGRLAGSCCC